MKEIRLFVIIWGGQDAADLDYVISEELAEFLRQENAGGWDDMDEEERICKIIGLDMNDEKVREMISDKNIPEHLREELRAIDADAIKQAKKLGGNYEYTFSFVDKGEDVLEKVNQILDEKPSGRELIRHFCTLLDTIPYLTDEDFLKKTDSVCDAFLKYELKSLDLKAFNKDLSSLNHGTDYHEQLRMVDSLLFELEQETEESAVVEFPAEIRPMIETTTIMGRKVKGRIGSVYLEEEGMNMYFPHCDVCSDRNPQKKLLKNADLLYSNVIVSEVLRAMQTVLDPECKNEKLAKAIKESEAIEKCKEDPLYTILYKHGMAAISLASNNSHPRYCESDVCGDVMDVYLTPEGDVMANLTGGETVQITPTISNYDWIVDDIKRAVNIAKKKS